MALFNRRERMNDQGEVFDISRIEDEIRDLTQDYRKPPPSPTDPVPFAKPPVDVGKITAETIASAHEAAAMSLAELGKEVAVRFALLDQVKIDAETCMKELLDAAEAYRQAGKDAAVQIEQTAKLVTSVRDACKVMQSKLQEDREKVNATEHSQ